MRFREPILVGVIVFLVVLVGEALGHAWEEALTAGAGAGLIVWVFHSKKDPGEGSEVVKRMRKG